ncbi:type II toxin-antitoxin system PemK/MazF family toxin [Motilibacter deserti]|uniref:Type II toxin-antitoxin system PemK/MazF family toxin n=1 Tax=Motilibacter deserti TaxID=2714956 RepID=A0ABX0GPW5_9ACTN|nr:type II toxin-antitoxin system PemK/MazF family toxin [Motilibacter deserti]
MIPLSRGAIHHVNLGDTPEGHEAAFTRPALVLSAHYLMPEQVTIVVPGTRTRLGWVTHVEVTPEESGLLETTYLQCEQVRAISTSRISRRLGTANGMHMTRIESILREILGL